MQQSSVRFRLWFVSTAGVGGRNSNPPTYIHCALLRKPTKGANSNGMHGDLSTESRPIGGRCYRQTSGPEQVGTTNVFIPFSFTN